MIYLLPCSAWEWEVVTFVCVCVFACAFVCVFGLEVGFRLLSVAYLAKFLGAWWRGVLAWRV